MIRDARNSALLATDLKELDKYRMEKQKTQQIKNLVEDVDELKKKIANIYAILETLTEEK